MSTSQHSQRESSSWVFASVKTGIPHTITQLKHITNVESVIPVAGRFDLAIKLRTNDPEKAFNAIEKIREVEGITATQTALSLQHISNSEEGNQQPIAFALMKVRGVLHETLRKLKTFPNFVEAHVIPGEFDILAAFHGHSPKEVLENSIEKIGSINGVTGSETLIAWTPAPHESYP